MVSIVCRHVAHLEPLAWPKLPTGAPISILAHHFPIFVFMESMESRMPLESIDDSTCYLLPIGNSFQLACMYPGQPLKHNAQERI